ncbi:hypothetical protein ACROYT_G008701 [Oculina patagonica]
MLVHGRAVCDELYPISVVEDIAQNQPKWSSDNYIDLLQGKRKDETVPASNLPQSDYTNQQDLAWMKTDIVDRYRFEKDRTRDIWTKQPDFKTDLGSSEFIKAADRVKAFFDRNNDWEKTKKNPEFRTEASCTNLLYITAARYLLVTHILYVESGKKLVPCTRTGGKIAIPDSGICYPAPYGSATCTSDYDVGLIGKDAGFITKKFNDYFQGSKGFRKPSELVFDTNVYAFTLEYAMPLLFTKLSTSFTNGVNVQKMNNDQKIDYNMRELASSYYKVYKYNEAFFNKMKDGAINKMQMTDAKSKSPATSSRKSMAQLNNWLRTFNDLNTRVPIRQTGSLLAFRTAHNNEYQTFVEQMSDNKGYNADFLGTLSKALIYAAEAYHTLGAIRFVVGGTQMKVIDIKTEMTTMELWVSMIENWGESNKEYNHYREASLEECFLKMSKYMWRLFSAMKLVRDRIPASERAGLLYFEGKYADPLFAMEMWLDYKKQGKTAIPRQEKNVKEFLRQFGCKNEVAGRPLTSGCVSNMNDKVNAYNVKLAGLVTDEPVKATLAPLRTYLNDVIVIRCYKGNKN